ncbi:TRAP transporter substrate-binding protein DctP [Paractinoplanes rishiriensis]|uniref:C4-dicarboxylate ABC transporter n=1 Tax=Paractinoplanes rishiriensis TaxID=1050105 RepID=A0A919K178_9ACTN|nr:TRAP transporter substrate-binding protein DctP [Actinoplanes rishiriensis]GIE97180.1 C4-dicarboxylate ABC transporter [Actinoplanes rishiriensis]
MDRRHLLTLALGATTVGACGGRSSTTGGDGPIVVKVADAVRATNPMVAAERYFAEQVGALTQGRYRVEVSAGGVLGDDNRVNEMVRTGQVAFAKTLVSNLSAYDKRLGVLGLPYVFAGEKECMAALDGELGRRCATILYESGLVTLAYFYGGERNLYNAKRPIQTPADVKGLRIRVPQNIVSIDIVNAMGASAVPMATNDILSALQQQVVDGAENNTVYYVTEQHVVYAPYYSRTRHQQSVDVLIASRKWLSEQPADVQDAIKEAGRRTQTEEIRLWALESTRSVDAATAQGAKVNDADVDAFRRAVAPVLREHRGAFGDLATLLPDD